MTCFMVIAVPHLETSRSQHSALVSNIVTGALCNKTKARTTLPEVAVFAENTSVVQS